MFYDEGLYVEILVPTWWHFGELWWHCRIESGKKNWAGRTRSRGPCLAEIILFLALSFYLVLCLLKVWWDTILYHIFSAMLFYLITRTNTMKPGNHKLQFSTQSKNSSSFPYTKSYLVILSQKQEETSTLYKKKKCLKVKSHVWQPSFMYQSIKYHLPSFHTVQPMFLLIFDLITSAI